MFLNRILIFKLKTMKLTGLAEAFINLSIATRKLADSLNKLFNNKQFTHKSEYHN